VAIPLQEKEISETILNRDYIIAGSTHPEPGIRKYARTENGNTIIRFEKVSRFRSAGA
jgi:hypothetical protein